MMFWTDAPGGRQPRDSCVSICVCLLPELCLHGGIERAVLGGAGAGNADDRRGWREPACCAPPQARASLDDAIVEDLPPSIALPALPPGPPVLPDVRGVPSPGRQPPPASEAQTRAQ